VQSLNIRLMGGLKIAGQEIDLGTLDASYDRVKDRLTLAGKTKLLQFGSKTDGNFVGLENVLIEIGSITNLGSAKILRMEATVSAGLSLQGAAFAVDQLTVRYLVDSGALQILGTSTLTLGDTIIRVAMPAPGLEFANGTVSLKATALGEIKVGSFAFKLNQSSITYRDDALDFGVTASVLVDGETFVLAGGSLLWKNNAVNRVAGRVSGTLNLSQATLSLENLAATIDLAKDSLQIQGAFQVKLLSDTSSDPWVRVSGSIGITGGKVTLASGKVEAGSWEVVPGIGVELAGLNFEYNSIE
jgi:hypothetical protein